MNDLAKWENEEAKCVTQPFFSLKSENNQKPKPPASQQKLLKKRLSSAAGPYLTEACIFNERFNLEREIRVPIDALITPRGHYEDFWLSLKGFKETSGTQEINREMVYEILEHKVIVKQLMVDKNLMGQGQMGHCIVQGSTFN